LTYSVAFGDVGKETRRAESSFQLKGTNDEDIAHTLSFLPGSGQSTEVLRLRANHRNV
jgi:hypothetical protein